MLTNQPTEGEENIQQGAFSVVFSRSDGTTPRAFDEVELAAIPELSTQKTPDIRRHLA